MNLAQTLLYVTSEAFKSIPALLVLSPTPLQALERAIGMLSIAIAFGLSVIGAAWAISRAGSAGLAAAAERPELRTTAIIISALGEALGIYGLIIVILLLGALPGE